MGDTPGVRRVPAFAALTLLTALVSGCGADDGSPRADPTGSASPGATATASSPAPPRTTAPAASGTRIATATSEFGTMLFGPNRQAIYIWEREPSSRPECYGDCADAWPPVLTKGAPVATGDVDAKLLGTTQRRDGSSQVTYNDHPLYYYAHERPGEVKCHNVSTHGGLWWVVLPSGKRAP